MHCAKNFPLTDSSSPERWLLPRKGSPDSLPTPPCFAPTRDAHYRRGTGAQVETAREPGQCFLSAAAAAGEGGHPGPPSLSVTVSGWRDETRDPCALPSLRLPTPADTPSPCRRARTPPAWPDPGPIRDLSRALSPPQPVLDSLSALQKVAPGANSLDFSKDLLPQGRKPPGVVFSKNPQREDSSDADCPGSTLRR